MNEFSVTPFSVTQLCDLIKSNNSDTQNRLTTISRKISQNTPLSAEEMVRSKTAYSNELTNPKNPSITTPNNNFPVRNEIHPRTYSEEPIPRTYNGEPIHSRYATPAIRKRLSPEELAKKRAQDEKDLAAIRKRFDETHPAPGVSRHLATPAIRVRPQSPSSHDEGER